MELALKLAKKGDKKVRCGALVGCVIVKNNKIIGQGYYQKFGNSHAEFEAISNATESVVGATLYVTLEPCSHHGKTPPCTDLIISSGIKKVVYGIQDFNPIVNGRGIEILKKSGVEVEESTLKKECKDLNKIFFVNKVKQRPFINIKVASTLNGKIADYNNNSKWISCKESRNYVHSKMRKNCDAIMTTAKTLLMDNSRMNVRINKIHQERHCIIIDKNNTIIKQSTLNIFSRKYTNVFILTANYQQVSLPNIIIIQCSINNNKIDIKNALNILLLKYNICEILVEAGSEFISNLLEEGLVDEISYFITPDIINDCNSLSSFSLNKPCLLENRKLGEIIKIKRLGRDLLMIIKPVI